MTHPLKEAISIHKSKQSLARDIGGYTPYIDHNVSPYNNANWNWDKYFDDNVKIEGGKNQWKYADNRRGISNVSSYYSVFGIPRVNFDKASIDVIRMNPYYLLMESALCNYLRAIDFDVVDGDGEHLDIPYRFLKQPNPQQSFWECMIPCIRDMIAYDAGVLVKTFSYGGYLVELRAYDGTQFRADVDRELLPNTYSPYGGSGTTSISHGYIEGWWQYSSVGKWTHYKPQEIVYFMQYPQSTTIYGTDMLKSFRFHFRYLMSTTVAAGKIMDNGLVTNLIMRHPEIGTIQLLKQRLDSNAQVNVGPENFGKTLHLIGSEDVKTINNTLVDMEWLQGQQFIFKVVMNFFGFPASEFSMEDVSTGRAASYVQRNIMRSRTLATVLSNLEEKINLEVLPYMRGYNKNWRFVFQREIDLDDQIKVSHITSTRASAFSMLASQGLPLGLALKFAGFGKELTPEERDSLNDQMMAAALSANRATPNLNEDQAGRYSGSDYEETYMGEMEASQVSNNIRSVSSVSNVANASVSPSN